MPAAGEPYIALATGHRLPSARCSFRRDDAFALDPSATPGVIRIDRSGHPAASQTWRPAHFRRASRSTSPVASGIASSSPPFPAALQRFMRSTAAGVPSR
jgi:hypothetical protein